MTYTFNPGDRIRYRIGAADVFIIISFDGHVASFVGDDGELTYAAVGDICHAV